MGESPELLLLGAVVFLILLAVAVFVGVLVYIRRAQAAKRPERVIVPPEAPSREWAEPASPAQGSESVPPLVLAETPARPGEVMRVIRDERTGRLVVEVEGQQYAHIREIKDAQAGRRVLWAIADLIRFTGGMATNPQAVRNVLGDAPQKEFEPVPQEDTQQASEQGLAVGEATPQPGSFGIPPAEPAARPVAQAPSPAADRGRMGAGMTPRAPEGATQPVPQRYSLVDFFRRGFQPEASATLMPGPSFFVDEIEEILQAHIRLRPTPLPYDVHVTTGPNNALQIEVGRDKYSSPEEVPDPEVRELIRAAVAEWERR